MDFLSSRFQSISEPEVVRLVSNRIPSWKKACDNADTDTVVLQQGAFGFSADELFLLSLAIKYAGMTHKTVMIAP